LRDTVRASLCVVTVATMLAELMASDARGQWRAHGTPVCAAPMNQQWAFILAAPGGGAFLAWWDQRDSASTDWDIYAQRIDASGVPLWAPDGVPVCTAADEQGVPHLAPDGRGGVIVVWNDFRSGTHFDVYAQRLSADGIPQWTLDGVRMRATSNSQYLNDPLHPCVTTDGAGGAIAVWEERITGFDSDIYAQRIDTNGELRWTPYGARVCTATGFQWFPTLATDGAGGAIMAWEDWRDSPRAQIFAQRLNASGMGLWGPQGTLIGLPGGDQRDPSLVSDGAGGAFASWCGINSLPGYGCDVYAQRISPSGEPHWAVGGVPLCTAYNHQEEAIVAPDGARGAVVCWYDLRNSGTGIVNGDVYAQYVDSAGVTKWTHDGVAVCTAPGDQIGMSAVSDGAGGALVVWRDGRGGYGPDTYAQHVDASGAPQWATDGVPLGIANEKVEMAQAIVSDLPGQAIVSWSDNRDGTNIYFAREYWTNLDIYAARITAAGVVETPERTPDGPTSLRIHPNPALSRVAVSFELPAPHRVTLEVLGLRGERVRALAPLGERGPGSRTVYWDGLDEAGRPVPAGIYFVRLSIDGGAVVGKLLWLK